jgi:membrane associated rhomboid family serine protease
MFMHASIFHLLGNVGVLWVFGDFIEDHFGRGLYTAFYLLCGTLASLTYVFVSSTADEPVIGASGAIASLCDSFLLASARA